MVTFSTVPYGSALVASRRDVALVAPAVIEEVAKAEADGADAIVVDSMLDPGVAAAREITRVPVVGPGEAGMRLGALFGARFSLLCGSQPEVVLLDERARRYCVAHRLASVRPIGTRAAEFEDDPERTLNAVLSAAAECVTRDGAHVIVMMGSTDLVGAAPTVA